MLKKMKKTSLIIIMLISVMLLSGCVNQSTTISINDRGLSSITYKFISDQDKFAGLGGYGIKEPQNDKDFPKEMLEINPFFRKAAKKYKDEGMDISAVDDNFEVGFVAYKEFDSPNALNGFIKEMHKKGLSPIQGELKSTNLKVMKNYEFKGTIEYLVDEDIKDELIKYVEGSENPEIQTLIEGTSTLEVITPGKTIGAKGFDESKSSAKPIFSNNINGDQEVISYQGRYVNKQGVAVLATFLILLAVALIIKVFKKIKYRRMGL